MKKTAVLLGLLALSGWLFAAAPSSKTAKAACSAQTVSFSRDVLPIFQDHCAACHYNGQTFPGLNLATADAYSAIVNQKSGEMGKALLIKPGDIQHSFLVQKLSSKPPAGEPMPTYGRPLSAQEKNLIEQWVLQGAKEN